MRYLILAYDARPEDIDFRMAHRDAHLEYSRPFVAAGKMLVGGSIWADDCSQITGSMIVVEFDTEAEMRQWIENDPYILNGVWNRYEVKPFQIADIYPQYPAQYIQQTVTK